MLPAPHNGPVQVTHLFAGIAVRRGIGVEDGAEANRLRTLTAQDPDGNRVTLFETRPARRRGAGRGLLPGSGRRGPGLTAVVGATARAKPPGRRRLICYALASQARRTESLPP